MHHGPLVKRLRHGPLKAETGVRFSHGSPKKHHPISGGVFLRPWGRTEPCDVRRGVRICAAERVELARKRQGVKIFAKGEILPHHPISGGVFLGPWGRTEPCDARRGVRIPLCGIWRIAWEYLAPALQRNTNRKGNRTLANSPTFYMLSPPPNSGWCFFRASGCKHLRESPAPSHLLRRSSPSRGSLPNRLPSAQGYLLGSLALRERWHRR